MGLGSGGSYSIGGECKHGFEADQGYGQSKPGQSTANLPTNIVDFRGFDSIVILI